MVILWPSPTWSAREWLLGTFVFPGALASAFVLLALPAPGSSCTGSGSPGHPIVFHCTTSGFALPALIAILMLIVAVVAPILAMIRLERIRRRSEADIWVPSKL